VYEKERGGAGTDISMTVSGKLPFQVELAPFQSVAISDDQIYIFRRIAVSNQIYRQGFILLVKPFAKHLLNAHYRNQPLAEFTAIKLQRKDNEQRTIVQAGISDAAPRFLAERVFPTPFDFLSVTLSAGHIPPSPLRNALHAAVIVLGVFMFFGLLAIYQSARTIVAMSERRSQFVSSVTHELKTPLTNIQMYTEMLEQGVAPTRRREQEYLSVVSSESARLSGLINNVLELARLEKKQRHFHMEDVHIKDLLAEVKIVMARKLENEGFTLDIQADDITFACDREVLVQVLVNVIENSVKFGRHLDVKQIRIIVDTEGQYARIAISDSGPGIPRGDIKKIFDDFHRVDNDLTRKTGGTGIGLALVRKFVTALGGSVRTANNDGPGCTITLFLRV
ncbi:MAG: HAMP domain-containing sensor histidine kinase, partial [Desulfocapsaceae bacterium]|nr:HAMP domain-containing sensor histidine kinase [Desulfocapsaceae bacterium]